MSMGSFGLGLLVGFGGTCAGIVLGVPSTSCLGG